MRRYPSSRLDPESDDRLTFADVTILAFLAVSALALAAVLLLGIISAAHRIAAALGHA